MDHDEAGAELRAAIAANDAAERRLRDAHGAAFPGRWRAVAALVLFALIVGYLSWILAVLPIAVAALISRAGFVTARQRALLSQLRVVQGLGAELRQATTTGDPGWALRWAELAPRLAATPGVEYTAPALSAAQLSAGVHAAAQERRVRLEEAARGAREVQERHERARPWLILLALVVGAVFVVVYRGRAEAPSACLIGGLAPLFAVVMVFYAYTLLSARAQRDRARITTLEAQRASVDALLYGAEGLDGAALMARWLTLRAEQESVLSEGA